MQPSEEVIYRTKFLDATRVNIGLCLSLRRLPLRGQEIRLALINHFLGDKNKVVSRHLEFNQVSLFDSDFTPLLGGNRHLTIPSNFG